MLIVSQSIRRSCSIAILLLLLLVGATATVVAQGDWRLLVVSDLTEIEARSNAEDNLQGFEHVEVIKDPDKGTYSVVLGYYPSREAAEEAQRQLQTDSGVMTVGPVRMPGGSLPSSVDPMEKLKSEALAAEASGDKARALQLWNEVRAKASGALFDEAGRKLVALQATPGGALPPPTSSGGGSSMLYIIIGVVVLAVGGGVAFIMMKKKQAPPPAPVAAPVMPKPIAPVHRPAPRPAAPAPAAAAPAPAPPRAGAASTPPSVAIPLATPAINLDESSGQAQPRQRRASLAAESAAGEVHLDFLDEAAADSGSRPSEQSSRALQFSPLADDMLLGGDSRGGQTPLFSQDFAKDPIGKQPANWSGDYEYASLLVEENDGKRALRFEKQSGTGSAYYCCRFPDAQGRIAAEFELRCDDKNKYLLGFYIEKDQDFRQSIHAIVHRANPSSPPVLKLQNESVEYEFGTWRTIRLEIDLTRQILDAFVDGKQVLVGTRLTSCPNVVNTLSFRDNLATTGILLVRNIRLYSLAA